MIRAWQPPLVRGVNPRTGWREIPPRPFARRSWALVFVGERPDLEDFWEC